MRRALLAIGSGLSLGLIAAASWAQTVACHLTYGGESQVIEAVTQIAGEAGERQLKQCDTVYVSGTGGVMSEQGALILQGA